MIDLGRIARAHIALVAGASILSYASGRLAPGSIVLGGALMGANLWLMNVMVGAIVRAVAEPGGSGGAGWAVVAMSLKFGLFLGLIAALFWRLPIEGMSFALGSTLLLVACVLEATGVLRAASKGVR